MMGTWDYTPCTRFHHLSVCQHYAGMIQRLESVHSLIWPEKEQSYEETLISNNCLFAADQTDRLIFIVFWCFCHLRAMQFCHI